MKLFNFSSRDNFVPVLGVYLDEKYYDVRLLLRNTRIAVPDSIDGFLQNWERQKDILGNAITKAERTDESLLKLSEIDILPPVLRPGSFRDFYAFLQHVKTARALRGMDVADEWYQMPVFYFSNSSAFYGPNAVIKKPLYTSELDFELEIACIIAKEGRDITPEEAPAFIAGFTILNDWSARDIQRSEMRVGLGPSKGKDFASSLGPFLVTVDELAGLEKNKAYDLTMVAKKNGQEISRGNFSDIYYSFAEMIAHASRSSTLYPGDVFGSGTVGTGCILELRPENTGGWLQHGDVLELQIEKLGVLKNTIE